MATERLGWLPLLSLVVFFISYSGGYANVPFILMGELFPARYRSILGPLSSSFNLCCTFIVVRSFPVMQVTMTKYGAFWFFMCCTLAGIAFVYFLLPETKGKTLEDIEKIFSAKYNADGTLKEPAVIKESEGKVSTIDIPSSIEMKDQSQNDNGISSMMASTMNTIDSEDEEEDDSLVPAPVG